MENQDAAERYCQETYNGHLIVYENKEEKKFIDENFSAHKERHSKFEPLGALFADDGQLLTFDGSDPSFIKSQMKKPIIRKGDCVIRLKSLKYVGYWKNHDIITTYDCNAPVPTFLCRSPFSEYNKLIEKNSFEEVQTQPTFTLSSGMDDIFDTHIPRNKNTSFRANKNPRSLDIERGDNNNRMIYIWIPLAIFGTILLTVVMLFLLFLILQKKPEPVYDHPSYSEYCMTNTYC